jgi:hypothetical protein
MNARDTAAICGLAFTVIVATLVMLWWHYIEAPSRAADHFRHMQRDDDFRPVTNFEAESRAAEKEPAEWTEDLLRSLNPKNDQPLPPTAAWDFAAWEAQQLHWLEGARDAAKRWDTALESGAWADAWWTRRR